MHPLERLFNLVALLLDSETPLTFDQIQDRLPAYSQGDAASAKRMFERDKDSLRELGVPIELAPTDVWETEEGYIIPSDRSYLPEIAFTPDELSALFVAAAAPGDDDDAAQAFRKLMTVARGAGDVTSESIPAIAPDAGGAELKSVADAMAEGKSVRFSYRTAAGVASDRHVDPYSLVVRTGNVYLVGKDRRRDEIRSFRLSRLASGISQDDEPSSPVPKGFRARDHISAGPWGKAGDEGVVVRIALSPDAAWLAASQLSNVRQAVTRADGWVELETSASAPIGESLAMWVLSFGDDAEVIAPQALRDLVVQRLEDLIAAV